MNLPAPPPQSPQHGAGVVHHHTLCLWRTRRALGFLIDGTIERSAPPMTGLMMSMRSPGSSTFASTKGPRSASDEPVELTQGGGGDSRDIGLRVVAGNSPGGKATSRGPGASAEDFLPASQEGEAEHPDPPFAQRRRGWAQKLQDSNHLKAPLPPLKTLSLE